MASRIIVILQTVHLLKENLPAVVVAVVVVATAAAVVASIIQICILDLCVRSVRAMGFVIS